MSAARDNPEIFPNDPEQSTLIAESPDERFPVTVAKNESDRIAYAQKLNHSGLMEFDALQWQIVLKNAEAIIKLAQEINKEDAIGKLEGKEAEMLGCKVAQRRAVEYEYAHPRLAEIENEIESLKNEGKKIKLMLQSMKKPMADPDTGEMIEPAKKLRDGVTIAITLPK